VIALAIDAATYAATAALIDGGVVLASVGVPMRHADREALMPSVAELFVRSGITAEAISRIVCGAGPGSFTSLRIAASIAKGLAMGLGRPLFAVSSLALLAADDALPPGRYLAALDALRGEHYIALYDRSVAGPVTELLPARLAPSAALKAVATQHSAALVGPGQQIDLAPHAAAVVRCASLLSATGPVELVSWEPDYGRKAEAQVKWEAAHGRPLAAG
jgi:tRNA threonylcarbamoyladenosine biosynthesis protein TsaB